MPHDPALIAEVRAWLSKAAKDLAASAYESQADPPFADGIVFHSQQAVEKSLKAFLSWHRLPFRKTHNLVGTAREVFEAVLGRMPSEVCPSVARSRPANVATSRPTRSH